MQPGQELFIVEGVSAANAVDVVRDQVTQFVHAMQGKPLNAARASDNEIGKNERATELARRITRNASAEFDPHHIPFERIVLLTDGDVDGVHAKALLVVLIDRLVPDLVPSGRLHTVRAPTFSIACDQLEEPLFAFTAAGRDNYLGQLVERGATNIESRHLKGLASMNGDDLWRVCLDPATRQLTAITAQHVVAAAVALDQDTTRPR